MAADDFPAERIAELEAERDRLQAELDSIANRATDRWLGAAQFESKALAAMQQTVSWRVTRPLRAVRGGSALPKLLERLPRKRG
jgi:hypothetical protein